MKNRLLLLAAGLLVSVGCFAQEAPTSRVVSDSIDSRVLGTARKYSVYLPAGYETSDREYPVLYLLHGAWDDYRGWVRYGNARRIADRIIAEGFALPMIIVMPDGSGMGEAQDWKFQGYFNQEGWNYEDFFYREFIPHIESKYRISSQKNHRAISGLSMGGGGTASYALRHPDMFGSACPLSGALGSSRSAANAAALTSPLAYLRSATPAQLDAVRTVRWFVDCGDDDSLWEANTEFYMEMKRRQVPLEYRMRNGGHNWEYWQVSLPEVLQFISVGFAKQ